MSAEMQRVGERKGGGKGLGGLIRTIHEKSPTIC